MSLYMLSEVVLCASACASSALSCYRVFATEPSYEGIVNGALAYTIIAAKTARQSRALTAINLITATAFAAYAHVIRKDAQKATFDDFNLGLAGVMFVIALAKKQSRPEFFTL